MWLFCLLDPFIPTQIKFLATPLKSFDRISADNNSGQYNEGQRPNHITIDFVLTYALTFIRNQVQIQI